MDVRIYRNDDESVKEYEKDLKFWSNALGELHCPHGAQPYDITEEELPDELKRVYNDLFFEPSGGASLRYMVETENGYGIALLNEYDLATAENSEMRMRPLFETVVQDAKNIGSEPMFESFEVFAGEFMGFDGCHELVVVVPWDTPVEEYKKMSEKLDEMVYVACGLNAKRAEALQAVQVENVVLDWLQKMRMQEGELIYATNLDVQSDEYKKMAGLVAGLCQREFPDLYEAVFGDGVGTKDLIFKDKWQEGCFKLYYYNPDSSAGGLIEECPFDVVDATEMIGNENYMDVLAEHTHYLSDVNSEQFFQTIFGLLEMKRDGHYLGCDVDAVCKHIELNAKGLMEILADAQEKSVRFMTDSVVGIGDFVEDGEMKKVLNDSFVLRNRTLDACYAIPGYEKLSHADKNALYDLVKKAIEKDMGLDRDFVMDNC